MDGYNLNEMVLLATNIILAPGLIYLGITGFRDDTLIATNRNTRLVLRRRTDRYPGVRDRRRQDKMTVLERRQLQTRRESKGRRAPDRIDTSSGLAKGAA